MAAQTINHHVLTERMREVGIVHFDGREVLTLRNRLARARSGAPKIAELPVDLVDNVLLVGLHLEIVRAHLGRPITVLGWYRPSPYNERAGGTRGSTHTRAAGVDIRCPGYGAELFVAIEQAWRANPSTAGLGIYRFHRYHVDVIHPGGKRARRWKGRKMANTSEFRERRRDQRPPTPAAMRELVETTADIVELLDVTALRGAQ